MKPGEGIDAIARDYLATCHSIDFGNLNPNDVLRASAALSREGIERASEARSHVLLALARTTPTDRREELAKNQLEEWVAAELELMESGEKYLQMHDLNGPFSRIALSTRVLLANKKVDWDAVRISYEAVDALFNNLVECHEAGVENGVVSTTEQAEARLEQIEAIAAGAPNNLLDCHMATRAIPDSKEAGLLEVVARARGGAERLANYLRNDYLPHTISQTGVGPEKYELWARKTLGADVDLIELYHSCWRELRELWIESDLSAGELDQGKISADVVWRRDSMVEGQVLTSSGLVDWLTAAAEEEANAVDGVILNLPDGARDYEFDVAHQQFTTNLLAIPRAQDRSRPSLVLVRFNAELQIPTWSYRTAVHAFVFPGAHTLHCFQDEAASGLRPFQRILASGVSVSGWENHCIALGAAELEDKQNPSDQLAAAQRLGRRLVQTACDIGFHLGLEVPADAPDFVGEIWDEDLVGMAYARWFRLNRTLALFEARRVPLSPTQALAGTVGMRIYREALGQAMSQEGNSFDLCDYHDRVLRVPPMGATGLSTELMRIAASDSQVEANG